MPKLVACAAALLTLTLGPVATAAADTNPGGAPLPTTGVADPPLDGTGSAQADVSENLPGEDPARVGGASPTDRPELPKDGGQERGPENGLHSTSGPGGHGYSTVYDIRPRGNKRAIPVAPRTSGPTVPGRRAKVGSNGLAAAPADAPQRVKQMIWTANRLVGLRYRYGGGHASFSDSSYDCSGAVSYALRAGELINAPRASGGLAAWARSGRGEWVTVYAHRQHAYMVIAGLRLDTSRVNDPAGSSGPRWRKLARSPNGFVARHPVGM
jgi:cell wall-associated NlpC family hydrolase